MKKKTTLSEPESREVKYSRKVHVCSRCDAWFRIVYFYCGNWLCLGCLKDIAKTEGRPKFECWNPHHYLAQDVLDAGHIRTTSNHGPDRKVSLLSKGLLSPNPRRQTSTVISSSDSRVCDGYGRYG